MRGLRLDGVVIDEVAWIKPSVWEDILQPALADRLGWALFIGTPWGVNLFSQLYQLAERTEGWHAKTWTVYETGAIDDAEVKRLRETMTEAAFAREMLCDFAAAGDDQLISLADVITAAERTYTLRDIELAPVVLGVDPARFGDDRSVIVRRQGLNMFPPEIYNGIDNMALASRVAAAIVEYRPKAVFIDSGAGAGVIDRLRQLGHGVVEVPFGGKANKLAEFVNRRTEMWWTMKEWLELGGAIPDEPDLKQELATPTYSYDPAGRKKLESKEDIKKRLQGGSSPDIADGLALTFAYPVSQRVPKTRAQRRQESAYDPYAKL
jgi:hypothetical protein